MKGFGRPNLPFSCEEGDRRGEELRSVRERVEEG